MVELDWDNIPKDLCPICKTDKYLSPTLQFKINPECYHKICDSCVDRIFSLGPSPCPYPNCNKILRKNKFKTQIFDDLEVEKECDIRKKVLSVYNKKEADFKNNLDEYNKYLEEIETVIYKLMNGIDKEETEDKLQEYSILNKQSIEYNNLRKDQEYEKFIQLQNLEKRHKSEKLRLKKELIKQEERIKEESKQEMINKLQNSDSTVEATDILGSVKETMKAQSNALVEQLEELDRKYEIEKLAIMNNTKDSEEEVKEVPFTPFNGDRILELPYTLQTSYNDPHYNKMVQDVSFKASGYSISQYFERSLAEAFTGLDCYIQEEKALSI
ncbi:hypothetical protein B5S28_g660 [[Candida] boidinii]|uniref:Unnamed protein product n=1 Tax=Candida boidinii TaxID=5477 RepID=A0ACB5TMM7_CANBO|nr:hypothetical protein B5S28_g660 [[Candida] boidinii]OWB62728.1 hypothetical protein B5S29_g3670 [[Candida] boidinii]OWB71938.1 hypothetical protein B5S31_g1638 [[Candida] boidinii]OWB77872.1 hypothetical protein B5S32_g2053 [[Candida] boidinii]GME90336.1 unnamed protein product [[Candida] boidinii]